MNEDQREQALALLFPVKSDLVGRTVQATWLWYEHSRFTDYKQVDGIGTRVYRDPPEWRHVSESHPEDGWWVSVIGNPAPKDILSGQLVMFSGPVIHVSSDVHDVIVLFENTLVKVPVSVCTVVEPLE